MNERQLFQQYLAPTSPAPLMLEMVKGNGCWVWDREGKKYLDLISGISVNHLGHVHPEVVAAIRQQAGEYLHLMVYGELIQSPQVRYAEKLVSLLPSSLDSVYFTNSGAEATEGAMKLAKRATGRSEFIAFQNAYHGSTQGALSLLGEEAMRTAFRPLLPDIRHLRYGVADDLSFISTHTAAVFFEPVQAESGVVVPETSYVQALRKRCDETGSLLVFDECQTGFGKTGKLFALELSGVVPDILLLAKALGGGMPLGAFVAGKALMQTLSHHPVLGHLTTFGGHPVSCAAGLAALEVLQREGYVQQVVGKAQLFRAALQGFPLLQAGLLMSWNLETPEKNQALLRRCLELGVLSDWFLFAPERLRIAPPLLISEEEIKFACSVLQEAAASLS